MYEVPDIELNGLHCVYCYCVFNCTGRDLVYIGQTNNLKLRHKKHIPSKGYGELKVDKYLKTHMWTLDVLWIGYKEDASAMEKYFIKMFDAIDHGLNLTTGGELYIPSPEVNKVNSDKKKGILNPNHKKVYQYTLDGKFIKEWDAISIASTNCNINKDSISNCARGGNKTAGGYIWRYTYVESIPPVKYIFVKNGCKKLAQYSLNMDFVAMWDSVNEASRCLKYDCGCISRAARGLIRQYNGYIWRYIE